ncbi:hypothetical protein SDC9_150896 [bioreactor metagenome]|uniref:Uncharacterized protein n=1 Tax=bioreactor metagenome TaxID=1076179 RepID=A0A645ET34_9ZZZZ
MIVPLSLGFLSAFGPQAGISRSGGELIIFGYFCVAGAFCRCMTYPGHSCPQRPSEELNDHRSQAQEADTA